MSTEPGAEIVTELLEAIFDLAQQMKIMSEQDCCFWRDRIAGKSEGQRLRLARALIGDLSWWNENGEGEPGSDGPLARASRAALAMLANPVRLVGDRAALLEELTR